MPEIGAMLREARMRGRIDVSEIEQQTKIRAKYLRALENEEWDLLPGPTYVTTFLRTYAEALGLDARMLVEEYRRHYERPSELEAVPLSSSSASARRRGTRSPSSPERRRPSRGLLAAGGAVVIVVVLIIIGTGGSGSSSHSHRAASAPLLPVSTPHRARRATRGARALASLRLQPTGQVYVCLVSGTGRKLLAGVILLPGAPEPVHRARRLLLTVGNGNLTMQVNGHRMGVPASANPQSYEVTTAGRRPLPAAQAPRCA